MELLRSSDMRDDGAGEVTLTDRPMKGSSDAEGSEEQPAQPSLTPGIRTSSSVLRGLYAESSQGIESFTRLNTEQNLTGASVTRVRRKLAQAWRSMLMLRISEALDAAAEIEVELGDVPALAAERLRPAVQLLRAAGFALQDDRLSALAVAVKHLRQPGAESSSYVAATLCRLGFWQTGQFEIFYALPRHHPRARMSRSKATSAVVDMFVEATVSLEHLNVPAAKRLVADALSFAKVSKIPAAFETLPASLLGHILYEEGCLDEADSILRERLPTITATGPVESALRAHLVLARIAKYRGALDLAAILLREAQALGERREWPRVVAACLAERVSLLLRAGHPKEALRNVEYLERYAEGPGKGRGVGSSDLSRYYGLARARMSHAEGSSRAAVACMRKLYHDALERRDPYRGYKLAIELTGMLAATGEIAEATILLSGAVKVGAAAGFSQAFLEGGPEIFKLLSQTYDQLGKSGSADREMLPFLSSLLARWDCGRSTGGTASVESAMSDILTPRERNILAMISHGLANKRIARTLEISPETVKSHVKRIFLKLAVGTRAEAVSQAKSLGLF